MKKITLLSTLCFLLLTLVVNAQTPPNAFNYSAVARNAAGQPIATTTIGIQITILKTSPTGVSQYSENHFINTDAFGLFNLVIGAGAVQSGSMATIDWSIDNYYLKVGMDAAGGTNFLIMGTTQLLSVPYALYAKSAGSVNGGTGITITSVSAAGDTLYLSNGQSFVAGGNGGGTGSLVLPTITTNAVSGITSNSGDFSGSIAGISANQIINRGFVFSTSQNPNANFDTGGGFGVQGTIQVSNGIGTFDTIMSSLGMSTGQWWNYPHYFEPNTIYYVRAYVVTENNIIMYGNEVSFTTLSIGQIGPSGGIVFYDKGNTSGGWQYLEITSTDQNIGINYGCSGTSISGTQNLIGSGESNTNIIVAGCNETSFAAKLCDNLILGGQSDWFLPSMGELKLIYRNLHLNGIGNFTSSVGYWSSTEANSDDSWSWNFGSAFTPPSSKNNLIAVRAIRAF